jgi:hypothetical protein
MFLKSITSELLKRTAMLAVFTMALSISVLSQSGTSSVSGTVVDPQGSPVPGAAVTLISGQNFRRSTTSSAEGVFTFPGIPPGSYRVEVELKGFKKTTVDNVTAAVDKATAISVVLSIGEVSEVVTVDASSIENIVNTTDASLGNNFQSQQIIALPLAGRNVGSLLSLQAAVTPDGSVSGSRSDQANITLDGVDVNEQVNGAAFSPVLRVTPDSVEEFRVTTQNADASKGRSSGAQISLITKSGDNQFKGALYEYYRGPGTTANNFFNNASGTDRPGLIRHLFGGRLGGPVIKDKLFFFYNYEGMRESKSTTVNRVVPLPSLGQGQLKYFNASNTLVTLTTAQINALVGPTSLGSPAVVDVNPAVVSLFAAAAAKYPSNNCRVGDCLNTGGFQFNAPAPVKLNTHTAKFDYNLNENHTFSIRGNYQQDLFAAAPRFPDTPGPNTWSHPLGISAKHSWRISNNLVNNFTFGLTRNAFSQQGDSDQNLISFGNIYPVFTPFNYSRTFARTTPVYNFTDDVSYIRGNHTFQFGINFRFIRNATSNFSRAFDNGFTNETFYATSGDFIPWKPVEVAYGTIPTTMRDTVRGGLSALFGRFSQYAANYNFKLDGTAQASGTGVLREFATEEYDGYVQDVWKLRPNLTVTLGLRYGISMPIYETQGFETKPNIPLKQYLERRIRAAELGQNYTEPITVVLSGRANGKDHLYPVDTNNWQPRVAVAWTPKFQSGFLASLFGKNEESVIRGGWALTYDYFGQALALGFDANNQLGFSATSQINFNTFTIYESGCTTPTNCRPGPLFTGLGMAIKGLPQLATPTAAVFPQQQPSNDVRRIQGSLDTDLVSPRNYAFNLSYGRSLPGKMYLDVSYQGRLGRNLLASRDIMAPNNVKDPVSGQTWYQATLALEEHRKAGTPIANIPNQPWFENMYGAGTIGNFFFGAPSVSNTKAAFAVMSSYSPDCAAAPWFGCYEFGIDWTYLQDLLDGYAVGGKRYFYQRQYGALAAFGTIGSSDYHGGSVTLRQRMSGLSWDFNYTFSKSMDDASGLQNSANFGGGSFILNAIQPEDFRAVSDFDLRHIVNANAIWDVPVGKGKMFFGNMGGVSNAILGGWQMSGVFRYNTGYPFSLSGVGGWPTNWNRYSYVARIKDVKASGTKVGKPNNFSDVTAAYRSFRSPGPGESGDRNQLRLPSYWVIDMGLQKSFNAPWKEGHKVSIRAEAFNLTNSAQFTGFNNASLNQDPQFGTPPPNWGNYTSTQGGARVMQFAVRYDF